MNFTSKILTSEKLDGRLAGKDLSGLMFNGAKLHHISLAGANLTGANLSHAELYCVDLTGANLTGANLVGADILDANLSGVNLTKANLIGAKIKFTSLSSACLSWTNLKGTWLERVNMTGADFRNAVIGVIGEMETHFSLIQCGTQLTIKAALEMDFSTVTEPIGIIGFPYEITLFPSQPEVCVRIGCRTETPSGWADLAHEYQENGFDEKIQRIYDCGGDLFDLANRYQNQVTLLPEDAQ